jgi:hypothetical protein
LAIKLCNDKVLEIKLGDDKFKFSSDMVEYPRAAISVSKNCPDEVIEKIGLWLNKGYIFPVAYVKESDYIWEQLKK